MVVQRKLRYIMALGIASALLFFFGCKEDSQKTKLWNGSNFSGWIKYAESDTVNLATVWQVKDDMIYCTGNPYGYIRTEKTYSDYKLHVEWRWPEKPGNSGVFLRIQDKDKIFPTCVEAQLKAGNAGDFVALGESLFNQLSGKKEMVAEKEKASSEKEPGKWNTYDITCKNDSIKLKVNGVLQNVATGVNISGGYIGLQSEGTPIEFKNIYLEKL